MVTLAEAIRVIYPNARPLTDYVIQDNGSGPVIVYWNQAVGPQPTQAQIDAVADADVKTVQRNLEPFLRDLLADAQARKDAIATYLAIPSPMNAQVTAEFRRSEIAEDRIIDTLVRIIYMITGWRP